MKRCGDFGGRKADGTPCRRFTRSGRCPQHAEGLPPRPTRLRMEAFLTAFARLGAIGEAAEAVGQDRGNHRGWLAKWPEYYGPRFRDVEERYVEQLEREADRRAVRGAPRLKFYKGEPIMVPCGADDPLAMECERPDGSRYHIKPYVERQYSDLLLMFRLKKLRPEYRDSYGAAPATADPGAYANSVRQMLEQFEELHEEDGSCEESS